MRGLVIFAILCCAAAGMRVPSYATQQDLLTRLREEINKDSYVSAITSTTEATTTSPATPIASSSSSSTAIEETNSTKPTSQVTNLPQESGLDEASSEAPISLLPLPVDEPESHKRRYVTYDQRQEGQYNIRADLDNFMIVLIPPNPVEGLNLLDLLTKSSYRRSHQNSNKSKRKHSSVLQLSTQNNGLRQALKSGTGQNFNYISRSPSTANLSSLSKQVPIAIIEGISSSSGSQRMPEFIEGRTPYHVDISASDSEQSRIHPDLQVDVLPPPYPLAYQHLIKPFHLEAEPTVIQALPPSEMHTARVPGNFLESYNQLLTTGLQTAAAAESSSRARHNNDGPELGYYRISRAIRSDNSIDSNNLSSSPNPPHRFSFFTQRLLGRYPPIDIPEAFLTPKAQRRSSEQHQEGIDVSDQTLDDDVALPRIIVPPLYNFPQDDIEQDLHNVRLVDLEAKALLSDGMERCAPGHRRDSYGMCREIEGY